MIKDFPCQGLFEVGQTERGVICNVAGRVVWTRRTPPLRTLVPRCHADQTPCPEVQLDSVWKQP